MNNNFVMSGNRLGISFTTVEEASILSTWLNDFYSREFLGMQYTNTSLNSEIDYIKSRSSKNFCFTIYTINSLKPIGVEMVSDIDHINKTCEIGVFIGDPAFRRGGYATEAVSLLLKFVFESLYMNNILIRMNAGNKGGEGVALKLGFTLIGKRRSSIMVSRKYVDDYLYDLTYEDYCKMEGNP